MTVDEAIEIQEQSLRDDQFFLPDDLQGAMKLGIEALKFRLRWEQQEGEDDFPLLPGETKE